MLPRGLTIPKRDAFREALPSDAPPADYPARLPFVANQAMFYAESPDLATCSWHVLPAGERPAASAEKAPRTPGMLGTLAKVREVVEATRGFDAHDPDTRVILDDLFDRILAAAAASGWVEQATATEMPPKGPRHVTLTRPGEQMEILALLSPFGSVVTAWSFAEAGA